MDEVQRLSSNWIFFDPTWTYTRQSPPILEIVPGRDPLWLDLTGMVQEATDRGMSVAIFPTPQFQMKPAEWWQSVPRDFSWWQVWFERYRNFIIYHADLANQTGAQAIVLGGEWLDPALPGGVVADGTPSGVPADAETRWRLLIEEVRDHFSGPVLWALTYEQAKTKLPPFMDSIDALYLLWSESLVTPEKPNPTPTEMESRAMLLFDNLTIPIRTKANKPIILGVYYPSADGAVSGCIPTGTDLCDNFQTLAQPNQDNPLVTLNFTNPGGFV